MSCSLRSCSFGKIKTKTKTKTKTIKTKRRLSNKRKSRRKSSRKSRRKFSRRNRKFGFKFLRNDQIIELVNSNKVYNNLTCD
jgi:hypothetical protein